MPLIKLQTNCEVQPAIRDELMTMLSGIAAKALGKPEHYVMVSVQPHAQMIMGGKPSPCAYFEVHSVGAITPAQAKGLSREVSDALRKRLDLSADRIYSSYHSWDGAMWGYDGGTFA
jgi:phenylpyruvate tautomerase